MKNGRSTPLIGGDQANQALEMSDGAATCKQDKAKVSSLLGRRAHENLKVET